MIDLSYTKRLAAGIGFDLCGLAPCRHLPDAEARFREWIGKGYHSSLEYLERNTEKRFDPCKLVDGARTAVICAVGYKNRVSDGYPDGHRTKVASYACAEDYHAVMRRMLRQLFEGLREASPEVRGRAFVDTAPLAEKLLAVEAGLGWIGRQSLLVTPQCNNVGGTITYPGNYQILFMYKIFGSGMTSSFFIRLLTTNGITTWQKLDLTSLFTPDE